MANVVKLQGGRSINPVEFMSDTRGSSQNFKKTGGTEHLNASEWQMPTSQGPDLRDILREP